MTESHSAGFNISYWVVAALLTLLAFFVYKQSSAMTLAFLLLLVLFYLVSFVALIPLVGFIVQGLVMAYVVVPWVMNFTGLTQSWVLALAFWLVILYGALLSFVMLLIVVAKS
jgi:hypothetical protein